MRIPFRAGWRITAGVVLWLAGLVDARAQVGYVWANNSSEAEYEPSGLYAHNPAGRVSIERAAAGRYTVRFEGLGKEGAGGGHVQVTSYGRTPRVCQAVSWSYRGPDFTVQVQCFDPSNGHAADSRFTLLAGWPSAAVTAPARPPARRPEARPRIPPERVQPSRAGRLDTARLRRIITQARRERSPILVLPETEGEDEQVLRQLELVTREDLERILDELDALNARVEELRLMVQPGDSSEDEAGSEENPAP